MSAARAARAARAGRGPGGDAGAGAAGAEGAAAGDAGAAAVSGFAGAAGGAAVAGASSAAGATGTAGAATGDAAATGAAGLRRFTRPAPPRPQTCELCDRELPDEHRHLVDTSRRVLACACGACAMLFEHRAAAGGRFRTVPERFLADPDGGPADAAWQALGVPVGTAFFFRNSALDRVVAVFPGPAGAAESEPDQRLWDELLGGHPLAARLTPDVEALLVHRGDGHTEMFLVPIDVAYRLVGRLRRHRHGFDGGPGARRDLAQFLDDVRERAGLPRKDTRP